MQMESDEKYYDNLLANPQVLDEFLKQRKEAQEDFTTLNKGRVHLMMAALRDLQNSTEMKNEWSAKEGRQVFRYDGFDVMKFRQVMESDLRAQYEDVKFIHKCGKLGEGVYAQVVLSFLVSISAMDPNWESITSKELLQFSTMILDILKWYPESIQIYYWSLESLLKIYFLLKNYQKQLARPMYAAIGSIMRLWKQYDMADADYVYSRLLVAFSYTLSPDIVSAASFDL